MAAPAFLALLRNKLLGNTLGFAFGMAASDAVRAPMRDVSARVNAAMPTERHTAEALSEMVVRTVRTFEQAAAEAQEIGINRDRFAELVALAGGPPGVGELLELWNRGEINRDGFDRGLRQGRIRPEWYDALAALRERHLSPETMAGLVARGLAPEDVGEAEVRAQGLNSERFGRMVDAVARPPAAGEILELVNRGNAPLERARQALRQSGLRAEWVDDVLELRRHIPSVSDQVRFAVREVYTPEVVQRFGLMDGFPTEFAEQAARVGLDREDAERYWAAHWDLPSPEQSFRMLHRGAITEADLDLILRANDYMPRFIPAFKEIAYLQPGRIDLRRFFAQGVITQAEVEAGYRALGYSPKHAQWQTEFALSEKLEPERNLAKAEVQALYAERELTREQALEFLGDLGYDGTEAAYILALVDTRERRTYRNAATGAVKRRYLDREVDEAEVTTWLDRVGVAPDARERLLDLWEFERDENPRRLTEAQARKAWLDAYRPLEWYVTHLRRLGYVDDEIDVLIRLYGPTDAGLPGYTPPAA